MTQWSCEKANDWYAAQPFLIGCNFLPSSASNQLEMFQAESFDVATLRREIGWAADLGFNCLRIYLHDLLIEEDGFFTRLDTVLDICAANAMRPILVLFDDCHYGYPKRGPQKPPIKGIHNSRWKQSPGITLCDKSMTARATQNWRVWKITLAPFCNIMAKMSAY